MDVHDASYQNWMFDYVWPRLEPAFNHVLASARDSVLDAEVYGAARKRPFPEWAASVEIVNRGTADGKATFVALIMNCNHQFEYSPGTDDLVGDGQDVRCDVNVFEGRKAATARIIRRGPELQFRLPDEERVKSQLDQWIDASVVFIRDSERLVVSRNEATE